MNNIKEPFVSVVTPVYNGEAFISECIESVLAQTYQNFEYLIVNNCSTDRTSEIINKYAKLDSRIRIHNNVNFLTSLQNQNFSMTLISPLSKYCKVVHADDWLFPECIAEMVKLAETDDSIGVVGSFMLKGSYVLCDVLPPPKGGIGNQYPTRVFSGRDTCRHDLYRSGRHTVFGNPTSILLRSAIILNRKEPFYDEQHMFMDTDACYRILQQCNFGFIYQVLSYMRKHDGQVHSFMDRNKAYIANRFYLFTKYGRFYLEEDEYKTLLNENLKKYRNFLKNNSLKKINFRKEKDFWDFHLRYLRLSGFPVRKRRLILYAISEFLDNILNPKRTFEVLMRKVLKNAGKKCIVKGNVMTNSGNEK
jgi:glycosyltransferase involved in cell wall biosynthesis